MNGQHGMMHRDMNTVPDEAVIAKAGTGIVVALKKELKGFLAEGRFRQTADTPYLTFSDTIGKTPVVLLVSGLGKARAAAATQFMIDRYGVGLVINAGTAGAVCPRIAPGDIVAAACCMEYDFRSISEGIPVLRPPRLYTDILERRGISSGVIGSADSNADSSEKKEQLHRSGITAADWEGAAVLKTCLANKRDVLILKVITDKAEEGFYDEFMRNVTAMTRKLAGVVRSVITDLESSR